MWMVDIPRVKGKIAEKDMTISSLADRLNVDRNTLAKYLKCPEKMPYQIISKLASILCNDTGEAISIFFAPDLRETKVLQDKAR